MRFLRRASALCVCHAALLLLLLLLVQPSSAQFQKFPPNVHSCVHATRKLSKRGDGSTRESCMGCDPTYPVCAQGCQDLIDRVYLRCDDICLPNGYYFDPQWELKGCWGENKADMKIKVERCGCNAAFSSRPSLWLVGIGLAVVAWGMR